MLLLVILSIFALRFVSYFECAFVCVCESLRLIGFGWVAVFVFVQLEPFYDTVYCLLRTQSVAPFNLSMVGIFFLPSLSCTLGDWL